MSSAAFVPPHAAAPRPMSLVIMGVSGSGKTSVGQRLAEQLGWQYLEGDLLHPQANIARMHAGIPLDDAARGPWLDAIGHWIDAHLDDGESVVVACSALKRQYRDRLRQGRATMYFAWLKVDRAELERRLRQRSEHFMPASLLDSQLATLEPPACDEPAFAIEADEGVDTAVHAIRQALTSR